jgi:hypothetical protein
VGARFRARVLRGSSTSLQQVAEPTFFTFASSTKSPTIGTVHSATTQVKITSRRARRG